MIDERGLAAREFDRPRREYRRAVWKQRRNYAFAGIAFTAWTAFCVVGAIGLVGRDHPYLGALLGTAVFLVGVYLAIRVWGGES